MQKYLLRRASEKLWIDALTDPGVRMIVVIPSYKEDEWQLTLESLFAQKENNFQTEVIFLINYPKAQKDACEKFSYQQKKQVEQWMSEHQTRNLRFHCCPVFEMDSKHAGVGLARKTGMDEAVRRFVSISNPDGVIVCLDADSTVHEHYLNHIHQYFITHPSKDCLSIGFKHCIPEDDLLASAIDQYEGHLHYYIDAQKAVGYPFAFQTLGSCMAVRAAAYCAQGGMNQRQAGEDFYFMHKYSILGTLGEIATPLVYPAARLSDRVPFGTGKAMKDYVDHGHRFSYSFDAIRIWGKVIELIPLMREDTTDPQILIASIQTTAAEFFIAAGIADQLKHCRQHSATDAAFHKRMMRWFDPFMLMKYLHYMRDHGFPDEELRLVKNRLLTFTTSDHKNQSDR